MENTTLKKTALNAMHYEMGAKMVFRHAGSV